MTATPLRVIVVDDEDLARAVLREYLSRCEDVEIVAECANGLDAVKAVTELAPDLMFLDIQMPKIDGFDVVDLLGRRTPVIFVTAYDEHAIRAFDVHAVDYLLKPVVESRFREALERARQRLGRERPLPLDALVAARGRTGPLERVLVRDGSKVHVLPAGEIDYVQAQDDYVAFQWQGKSYLKELTLADVESSLDPRQFVRIHRSYLLNIDRLARVEAYSKDAKIAILKDGSRLPVSRSGYARLVELL